MNIVKNINTFLVNFSRFFQFKRAVSILTSLLIIGTVPSSIAEGEKKKSTYFKRASDLGITNEALGFEGTYVGLTGGAELGGSKVNTNGTTNNGTTINSHSDLSHRGLSGGIVAGYGKTVKGVYLGAEVAGELSNANGKSSFNTENGGNNSGNVSARKKDSVSVAARIGKQIDEKTLLYAKAGIASNNYNFSSSIANETAGVTESASSSKNTRILQPIVGIGLERKIMKLTPKIDLHLGAEYEHSFGKATNVNLSSSTASGVSKFDTSSDAINPDIS